MFRVLLSFDIYSVSSSLQSIYFYLVIMASVFESGVVGTLIFGVKLTEEKRKLESCD